MPEIARAHVGQIQNALKALAQPEVVDDGRIATRRLLQEGRITLAPNAAGNGVESTVRLKDLGTHVLETAGFARRVSAGIAGAEFL